jgi:hypothetical protein
MKIGVHLPQMEFRARRSSPTMPRRDAGGVQLWPLREEPRQIELLAERVIPEIG